METETQHFPHCFQTQKTKWFKFSFEHLQTCILIVTNYFLEKKYVLELLNTFFFKFCPILEVNNRTIGDDNRKIERCYQFCFIVL